MWPLFCEIPRHPHVSLVPEKKWWISPLHPRNTCLLVKTFKCTIIFRETWEWRGYKTPQDHIFPNTRGFLQSLYPIRSSKIDHVGVGQNLLLSILMGWTSIYQLFWGSLGARVLTHPHVIHVKSLLLVGFFRTDSHHVLRSLLPFLLRKREGHRILHGPPRTLATKPSWLMMSSGFFLTNTMVI